MLYGRAVLSPAGISTLYLEVVRLRTMREPSGSKSGVQRLPPIKLTVTASVSSFVKERIACVGLPFTSLMPKISALGKEVETVTARLGLFLASLSSSTV